MGDVYDAMNRSEKERQEGKSQPPTDGVDKESPAEGALPDDVQAPSARDEKPGLPLDQVAARSLASEQKDDQPLDFSESDQARKDTQPVTKAVAKADSDKQKTSTPPEIPLVPKADRESLNGYSADVIVHHDRGSVVTEQYRAIRTQILARARNRTLQVHVLTSSAPQEGKSVTVANLGVAFSELRNKRTLIVEGDLRRPSFQNLFSRDCTPGLLQLLRGDITEIDQAIHHTVYDNLQFMPAGGRDPTHCTELLSSPRMAQILERLRDHYDHIFIDTPPVISVTDAAILAAMADQTLLVVRLHKTPTEMVDRAKRLLKVTNCNVAGIILTHMNVAMLPGYMSRYSYGSTYA